MLLSPQLQQHKQLYHKNNDANENGYFCLIDNNSYSIDKCIISIPLVLNCELSINFNNKNGKITLKIRLFNNSKPSPRPPTTTTRKRTYAGQTCTSTSVSNSNFTLLTDRQYLIEDFNSILNGSKLRFKLESDSVKADINENVHLEKFSLITNSNKLNSSLFSIENEFNLVMNNNNLSNLIDGKLIIELKDHNDNLLHKFDELLFEKLIKSKNIRKKKSKTNNSLLINNNNNGCINNNEKFISYNEDDETDGHVVGMKRCRLELFQQHQNTHEIHEHFINKLKQHQEHVKQAQEQAQQQQQFAELINLNLFDQELFTINLNESHLWCITENYENLDEWKLIGKQLTLNEQELLIIETKYFLIDGLKECFYQMLLKWRVKEPENCNLAYLLQTILQVIHIHNLNNKNFAKIMNNLMHGMKYGCKTKSVNIEQQNIQRLQIYLNKYVKSIELQEKLLNLKLSEKHLWNASNYIFQEWKSLARLLELSENDIILIESKYFYKDGIRECCYQTLLKWREIHSTQCLFNILCLKLINKNFNLYVCQLIEYFSTIIQF